MARKLRDNPTWFATTIWVVVFLIIGLIAVLLISLTVIDAEESAVSQSSVLAAAFLFAIASLAAGAFFGFLFGVPRTLASEPEAGRTVIEGQAPLIGANTNLEQVSDWLTKILIGATLVQLGSVPSTAARLFSSMAPALGGTSASPAFAGGIVVYFTVLGFLMGWLNTRLYLGNAMRDADTTSLVLEARKAAKVGDTDRANALLELAQDRATGPSGPTGPISTIGPSASGPTGVTGVIGPADPGRTSGR